MIKKEKIEWRLKVLINKDDEEKDKKIKSWKEMLKK